MSSQNQVRELVRLLREAMAIVEDLKHTRPLAFKGYRGDDFLNRAERLIDSTRTRGQGNANTRPITSDIAYWNRLPQASGRVSHR